MKDGTYGQRTLAAMASGAAVISGACLLGIFVANIIAIFGRYSGAYYLLWVPDLTRLLFIWSVFAGAAAATHEGTHLAVDFIRDLMPPPIRHAAIVLGQLLLLALLAVLAVKGWEFAMVRMRAPYLQLGVPQGYGYVALPIAAATMAIFTVDDIVRSLTSPNQEALSNGSGDRGISGTDELSDE